jgi:hypothetical protein
MGQRNDFVEQLRKQLRFLETSCREYDAGNIEEGIRIATSLRVLFHDTPQSTSLLRHLNATRVKVLSTAGPRQSTHPTGFWTALIQIQWNIASITVKCLPAFYARKEAHWYAAANNWWDNEIVFFVGKKRFFRKRLVLFASNKDGGAHVDSALPEDYEWLINGADVTMGIVEADGRKVINPIPDPHLAYLRQMAFEVLSSPEILKLAGF